MGKLEATIKSEIVRLAKREMRKTSVPLGRDVRLLNFTMAKQKAEKEERFLLAERLENF